MHGGDDGRNARNVPGANLCSKWTRKHVSCVLLLKRASLLLAALLQGFPLCRFAVVSPGLASPLAVISVWCPGALALLGAPDAVSGASAAVSGMVKYVGITPVGSPTNHAAEPMGLPFKYRITVTNPGVDVEKNYFNCVPLPPGLNINTNLGQAGYITGTPASAGIYAVTLVAGNANYPTPATLPATIVIYPPNAPPLILSQPSDLSVLPGSTAAFTVGAEGSWPLTYGWLRNGLPLAGRSDPTLTLTNVNSAMAGDYQAFVTNSFGSVTSLVARLTLRDAFAIDMRLGQAASGSDGFHFVVTGPIYTNYVIWRSLNLLDWLPIRTNFVIDGYLDVADPNPPAASAYYRASLAAP